MRFLDGGSQVTSVVIMVFIMAGACLGVGASAAEAQEIDTSIPSPLNLEQAVAFALRYNPELQVSAAFVSLSEADSIGAQTRPYNPELELLIGGGGGSVFSREEWNYGISLSQIVEIGGKRGLRTDIAGERVQSARAGLNARQQQVIGMVRRIFRGALMFESRSNMFTRIAEIDKRLSLAVDARVRDGISTPLAGRQTRLDYLRSWTLAARARTQYRVALADLMRSMGASTEQEPSLAGQLEPDSLEITEKEAVVAALNRRAERQSLLANIRAAQAAVKLADKTVLPDPELGLSFGTERTVFDIEGLQSGTLNVEDVDHRLEFRVSLPLPIIQRNQGGKARAQSEVQISKAELARFDVITSAEVRAAHREAVETGIIYRSLLRGTTRVEEDLELLRSAYLDGRITIEGYLTNRQRLTDSLVETFDAGEVYWEAHSILVELLAVGLDELAEMEDRP